MGNPYWQIHNQVTGYHGNNRLSVSEELKECKRFIPKSFTLYEMREGYSHGKRHE